MHRPAQQIQPSTGLALAAAMALMQAGCLTTAAPEQSLEQSEVSKKQERGGKTVLRGPLGGEQGIDDGERAPAVEQPAPEPAAQSRGVSGSGPNAPASLPPPPLDPSRRAKAGVTIEDQPTKRRARLKSPRNVNARKSKGRAKPVDRRPRGHAVVDRRSDSFDGVQVLARRGDGPRPGGGLRAVDYGVNATISTADQPVSTFSADVDTGSYQLARSHLRRGEMPPESAIRVEEMINAFDYAYTTPAGDAFTVQAEAFPSPNRHGYHVLHIGLKGREISQEQRKPANLVFVVDVSGSMEGEARLGLVKHALTILTNNLDSRDAVGLVVYGSDARVVLPPTRATYAGKNTIKAAVHGLQPEGATNVQAGLEVGYDLVARNFRHGEVNRVILCSDGVANAGATEATEILRRVRREVVRGTTISTVGFGMGDYNDTLMEQIADRGNGNYAYVDNQQAARKIFEEQLSGTLQVIAKDVKIQMRFNRQAVQRYRLLGFENRMLAGHQFADDAVDAGEIGAGHTVTALYEIKLRPDAPSAAALGQLRLRYKAPTGRRSHLIERSLSASIVKTDYNEATPPTQLSFVAASFAEKLRGSYWVRNLSYQHLLRLWRLIPAELSDREQVQELRALILTAESLDTRPDRYDEAVPLAMMTFDRLPVLR